ncbi:M16 family metallopeptidase [Deinococcus lacus]|uniref:M16 family metallopeptidase n=1 Tax=Deinococcus lacus TaxID=392561 RepID=A0ABW1YDR0_9DEIO
MVAAKSGAVLSSVSGLTLACERRAGAGFALDLRLPWGSAHDPAGQEGSAALLEEWLLRGAAGRDARALADAFDDLGLRRGGGVGPEATRFTLQGLRQDFGAALALLGDVLLRPALPPAELPTLKDLARQDLAALEDSPADLLSVAVRREVFGELQFGRPAGALPELGQPAGESYQPAGFGHPVSGTLPGLGAITAQGLERHWQRYGLGGSVLGVVIDEPADWVEQQVAQALGGWRPGECLNLEPAYRPGVRCHVPSQQAEQTHLSLTLPGVSPQSADWLTWQLALSALSGGSASRLFLAVREERGLAYHVAASPLILGTQGFLSVYAGTTPQRAGETLEVLCGELERWSAGLGPAELERARAGLVTGLVFGGETLRARAGALTRDLAVFGAVRDPALLRAELEAIPLEQVNAFLAAYQPLGAASLVTLGQQSPQGPALLQGGAA